ncbi:hypothetical protein NRP93_002782 [Clostridium botulinum]|nr:hypothetical protein [Clostridium botulinum]
MDSLKIYVDDLFSKYKENRGIRELKYEILSNLQAKVEDLSSKGMEYDEALRKAKESIKDIDNLIDGNIKVYINKYKLEYIQSVLLYFIIVWIITIPLGIIRMGTMLNIFLFILVVAISTYYVLLIRKNKNTKYLENKGFININNANKRRNIAWIIWTLYIVVSIIFTTGIYFGSNIWFQRRIKIDGPYNFAAIITRYMLPFISIIIPLGFNKVSKLILKYEVGDQDEFKE